MTFLKSDSTYGKFIKALYLNYKQSDISVDILFFNLVSFLPQ